ncbi:PPE domain-containing protein [Nocardia speluncae]|uniref:PPE domain-containing protein n=1 Tax=Nocardia speluncae TaxID=419477 RepID=A0A846XJD3_9NOCA|nr:PPE domain-containing protein [Nocardia speluncae]NKY34770.1 PPE domain-containing protein [Nocardia speluncae]
MPFFEYFALEPIQNRDLIDSGPGAAPMYDAARGYSTVDYALESAAAGTEGLLGDLSTAWPSGLGAERAQAAFGEHNQWVRDQARISAQVAALAGRGVSLHEAALAAMPPRLEIQAVMAALAATAAVMASSGAVASAGAGPVSAGAALVFAGASAAHAAAEAKYFELRIRAGSAMAGYEVGAVGLLMDLAAVAGSLAPPPPIAMPGPDAVPTPDPQVTGVLRSLADNGPDSPHFPADSSSGPHQAGGGSETSGSGPDSGGGDSGPGGEGPDPGPSGLEQQPLNDPQQSLAPQSGPDGYDGYDPGTSPASPLAGVSSGSSTLAALNGGAGALTGFGMMRGGFGSMPGAATGFRLPTGWSPGSGTAFGAPTSAAPPSAAPARSAARRVSAPTARMRRRRDEETREGKVFAPGEHFEVPELERPPAIGVIEYTDEEPDIELSEDSSLVGVLDRLDEPAESENGFSTR